MENVYSHQTFLSVSYISTYRAADKITFDEGGWVNNFQDFLFASPE